MKKYNIYNLYVVKVDNYYLICKYNSLNDSYEEIFTHEKINADNKEPLANYYPLLGTHNYITGKPLMLDKKELLRKYITIE